MKRKCFTLTELITALAIVAILAAIAVPRVSRWIQQSRIRQTAEEITSDLMWAQSLAMEKGSSAVAFDVSNNVYYLISPYLSTPQQLIKSEKVPSGITITPNFILTISANVTNASGSTISINLPGDYFKRNKLPAVSGNVTISGYGITYVITLNNISGRIKLERL
ncbi:pilus assembly FimT family protein [Desulfurobacterium sp.]